jgi:hypothetical protein
MQRLPTISVTLRQSFVFGYLNAHINEYEHPALCQSPLALTVIAGTPEYVYVLELQQF